MGKVIDKTADILQRLKEQIESLILLFDNAVQENKLVEVNQNE